MSGLLYYVRIDFVLFTIFDKRIDKETRSVNGTGPSGKDRPRVGVSEMTASRRSFFRATTCSRTTVDGAHTGNNRSPSPANAFRSGEGEWNNSTAAAVVSRVPRSADLVPSQWNDLGYLDNFPLSPSLERRRSPTVWLQLF